ncbi:pilus assembly protein TadG-related protein [Novosphingobium marinum]|uniref:pilus assembly protein TadG-related protein n=1 Tax=Novosphingobium marinum TaxID=1514948 RepID=UPI0015CCAD2A|nr:pilus assembly protein TadG-related protein [Novosphingobium marinum]
MAQGLTRRLAGDIRGNVFPIAGAAIFVAAAVMGGAVDMSRGYRAQNRLQAACDSAVLAGRRAITTNGYDSHAEDVADSYFATNFDPDAYEADSVSFTSDSSDNGNTVAGTATARVDTAIMKIFGFDNFDFAVACTATMGVGNSDVVMVLDTTGSMNSNLSGTFDTRIEALRTAMTNFYDTLAGATSGSNARIRYGFVPYSSSVNVGQLISDLDPDYLVASRTIQSRQAIFISWGEPTVSGGTSSGNWSSWAWGCPGSATSWEDYGSPSQSTSGGNPVQTQQQRRRVYDCSTYYGSAISRWRYEYRNVVQDGEYTTDGSGTFVAWEYKPVTYDLASYKTFSTASTLTGSDYSGNPVWESSIWEGCIEERQTVSASSFSYSSVSGMSPGGAFDLDIDSAPDTSNDATKWAPMWPEVAYRRWNGSGYYTTSTTSNGTRASSYCPARARLLSEMDESAFDAYANSLTAEGSTYLDIGMLWGARLSSPQGIFADNVNTDPDNGAEVARHIIFMTDGVMEPSYTIQSAYGIEYFDRRVTDNGYSNQASRHTSRFLAICRAIKAKGIRIWAIAFTSGLSNDLRTCASDNSSFTADDAEELDEAFQEIAKQVGELRIIQ